MTAIARADVLESLKDWRDGLVTTSAARESLDRFEAAVRRSAITEAVDRLTDAEIFDLVFAMTTARIPQGRELLRRALTEGA
jgi:hypothetical protein